MTEPRLSEPTTLCGNLLDEPLLHYRRTDTGERTAATLPDLFVAMTRDHVRDFPALRPHQRHPWHAFLVQLAAIALHQAGQDKPFATADEWRTALLALTPEDPDAAWCLVSPVNRPAFMQAPEPSGSISDWKNVCTAADELDMLVTSKNHDLKASRMLGSTIEDWTYALISLQTQEGFLGAGNYGASRMNGGFASRCGIGIQPNGRWGKRWSRDLQVLLSNRKAVAEMHGFDTPNPLALIWVQPWDGTNSLSLASLDPWYIEICRRVRLIKTDSIKARVIGSKTPRIAAKELNGVTGDPWMPVDVVAAKALTIGARGFDYKLASELLLGQKYTKPTAQTWLPTDDAEGVQLIAQGVARGQGKTEGYHERRIPVSRKVRQALLTRQTDELAKLAEERIAAIGEVRKMLWTAITVLFGNGAKDEAGKDKEVSDTVKDRASVFTLPFEAECDAQFFIELSEEIEADDRDAIRSAWLETLADRAERVLRAAFVAGPRNGQLRYRAQSAAMSRLQAAMRGNKFPALSLALKSQSQREETHESV
jgi:CRISPR type I-E/ECOLI-associated protein CasA/Cse1